MITEEIKFCNLQWALVDFLFTQYIFRSYVRYRIKVDFLAVVHQFRSLGLIMVYCAAFDCNNHSRRTTGISYHCFPSDPSIREQWLAKISRADLVISKHSRLCSEHFTPDCYERDLKAELLGSKPKAILKPDAIPLLFSHRPPPKKPRLSSERRSLKKNRQEVRPLSCQLFTLKG